MFQHHAIGSGASRVVKRGNMAAIAQMSRREKQRAVEPPPEQMARAHFVEGDVVDIVPGKASVRIGKAYRRKPKFETIDSLTVEQIKALRAYRAIFDASEMSPVKSGLDIRPHGSGGSDAAIMRLERIASGSWMLDAVDAAILAELRRLDVDKASAIEVLRDVALFDLTFKDCAMKRFGHREVSRIDIKRAVPNYTTFEVRSGTHRTIVRDEFMLAVGLLVEALARRGR